MANNENGKRITEFPSYDNFEDTAIHLLGDYQEDGVEEWTTGTFKADSLVKYYTETYLHDLPDIETPYPTTYMFTKYPAGDEDSYVWGPASEFFDYYVSQYVSNMSSTTTVDNLLTIYDGSICQAQLNFLSSYWQDSHYTSMTSVYTTAPAYSYDLDTADDCYLAILDTSGNYPVYSRTTIQDLASLAATDVGAIYENCYYKSNPEDTDYILFHRDNRDSNYICTISEFLNANASAIYDAISGYLNS